MCLPLPMDIGDGTKHGFDHRCRITLLVTVLFLDFVHQLLALVHRFHDDPVVGALATINFLLKEVKRLHDIIMLELLKQYAVIQQILRLILTAEFIILESQHLLLFACGLLSAQVGCCMYVCLLAQRFTDLVQVFKVVQSVGFDVDAVSVVILRGHVGLHQ